MAQKSTESRAASDADKSILLISRSPSVLENVKSAISAVPRAKLEARSSTLGEMNGHAVEFAVGSDAVIFETDAISENEISAIGSLVEAHGKQTIFIALTDGELPLSKARLLTRAGVDEILPIPAIGEELPDLVRSSIQRKAAALHQGGPSARQGAVIAVSQARGGIGATTIAANLAYLLQDRRGLLRKQAHKRVALVDLDVQFGTAGILLDVEDQGAMLEIATRPHPPDGAFMRTAMSEHKSGLTVLPAPASPIPLDALTAEKVERMLAALRTEYDYVVVDMPRALVPWIAPVLGCANKVLIATDTTVPGVRHARRLIEFYTEDMPALPIEVVIVRERRPMFLSNAHKEAAKVLEHPLSHWLPHDTAAVEAVDHGEPVAEFDSGSELSKALRKIAKSVATSLAAQPAVSTS